MLLCLNDRSPAFGVFRRNTNKQQGHCNYPTLTRKGRFSLAEDGCIDVVTTARACGLISDILVEVKRLPSRGG